VSAARGALAAVCILALALSCQRPSDAEVQAPGPDSHPPPQTSDGRVVGADGKSPAQALAEQPTTAHPAPGWKLDRDGVSYDPKRPTVEDRGSTRLAADAGADAASR